MIEVTVPNEFNRINEKIRSLEKKKNIRREHGRTVTGFEDIINILVKRRTKCIEEIYQEIFQINTKEVNDGHQRYEYEFNLNGNGQGTDEDIKSLARDKSKSNTKRFKLKLCRVK